MHSKHLKDLPRIEVLCIGKSFNDKTRTETELQHFTLNYISYLLTHSEAVIVNELDMKDCPSFKLTKTSRVLERKGKKKSAAIKHSNKGTYMLWSYLYVWTAFKKQRTCSKRGRWEPVPRSCTSSDFTEILKLTRLLCIMICRCL